MQENENDHQKGEKSSSVGESRPGPSGQATSTERVPIGEPATITETENETALEDRKKGQEKQPGLPGSDEKDWSPGTSALDD